MHACIRSQLRTASLMARLQQHFVLLTLHIFSLTAHPGP